MSILSWKRVGKHAEMSLRAGDLETISKTTFCNNIARISRILFDFLPQPVDIYFDIVGLAHLIPSPHLCQQSVVGENAPGIVEHVGQEVILGHRQLHRLAINREGVRSTIQRQALVYLDRRLVVRWAPGTPQRGTYTRSQLPYVEWLGHIVVGSQVQRTDDVLLVTEGSEHDDRYVQLVADTTTHFPSVDSRQQQVQQDQIGCRLYYQVNTCPTILRLHNSVFVTQSLDQRGHKIGVIFNDKNCRCHDWPNLTCLPVSSRQVSLLFRIVGMQETQPTW